jgi:hypothetical protein
MTATLYCNRCEFVWSGCYPKLVTDCICQALLYMSYGTGQVFWYLQCCLVSLALAKTRWYWLDWNMLQVIMITRLHAMYQRSRKILIFLIVTFLADNIFNGVVTVMTTMYTSGGTLNYGWQKYSSHWWILEGLVLSGTYLCSIGYTKDIIYFLGCLTWILGTVWEVFALCLAPWIAVKHFRELRRHSTGGIMEDCFTVLIKSHILYFARWAHVVNMIPVSAKGLDMPVLLLCLASVSLLISLRRSHRYVNLSLTPACHRGSSFL